MTISSRTPEGEPRRCSVCGEMAALDASYPTGDACCPACGTLITWFADRLDAHMEVDNGRLLDAKFYDLGIGSLDDVELVMDLEEQFDVTISDAEAERIQTVRQAMEFIRRFRRRPSE